jgi:hypothetical protein
MSTSRRGGQAPCVVLTRNVLCSLHQNEFASPVVHGAPMPALRAVSHEPCLLRLGGMTPPHADHLYSWTSRTVPERFLPSKNTMIYCPGASVAAGKVHADAPSSWFVSLYPCTKRMLSWSVTFKQDWRKAGLAQSLSLLFSSCSLHCMQSVNCFNPLHASWRCMHCPPHLQANRRSPSVEQLHPVGAVTVLVLQAVFIVRDQLIEDDLQTELVQS